MPLVEEGWLDHPAARLVAQEYLEPFRDQGVDTLVLGCTHYPLLKPLIAEVLGPDVALIDSAEQTAAEARRVLASKQLLSSASGRSRQLYVASDAPDQFLRMAERFLGAPIDGVETHTLG